MGEVSKNWMEFSSLNELRSIVLWQETNNFDEINSFFMNNWDTRGVLRIQRRLLQHFIRNSPILGSLMCQNTHHHMWWVRAKHQLRIRECQSGPSARNSVIPREDYGADQQQLQISDLHFDKFPASATFACWKIRFKTEVCSCSQFPMESMLWIKKWRWLNHSGWSQMFVFYWRKSNTRFWSTRCEDCFSTETNHP